MEKRIIILWVSIAAVAALLSIAAFLAVDRAARVHACNVERVYLNGELLTSDAFYDYSSSYNASFSDYIVSLIEDAETSEHVKGIIVEVDSQGGMPVAAEEIARALERSTVPSVALIRAAGTSAAYWAATGADHIMASRNSDVGGIGVTISLLNEVEKNEQEGRSFISISSAPFKNMGDPNKQLTREERERLQRDVDVVHENFVSDVAENRELAIESVRELADGATMLGEAALQAGLIDALGDTFDALTYLSGVLGEEAVICEPVYTDEYYY